MRCLRKIQMLLRKQIYLPQGHQRGGRNQQTETLQSCSLPEFRGFKKNPNDTLYLNENKLNYQVDFLIAISFQTSCKETN